MTWFLRKPPVNTEVTTWTWKKWFNDIWRVLTGTNYVFYRLGVGSVDPTDGPELGNEFMTIDYNGNRTYVLPPSRTWANKPYLIMNDVADGFAPKLTNVTVTSGSGDLIREGRYTAGTIADVFGRGDSIEFRSDGNGIWFVTNHHCAHSVVTGYLSADHAVAAAVALPGNTVPFDTEITDRFGENSVATYTFTCGHPGFYDIYLHLEAEQSGAGAPSDLYGAIAINGTNWVIDTNTNGGRNRDAAKQITVQCHTLVYLAYADAVTFRYAWTGAGAAGTINGGTSPKYSWFSIARYPM